MGWLNKKPLDYGPKSFANLDVAYNTYVKKRFRESDKPALAPKKKFSKIWDWEKVALAKKVAKPGK